MNAHVSKQPTKRTEFGQEVITDLSSRNIEGPHFTAFVAANAKLVSAYYTAQSAERDPRFAVLQRAATALFVAMQSVRKALMLSGISAEGHFGDFGVLPPWKLARQGVVEQVQQCRLLIGDIKRAGEQPRYLGDAVREALDCADQLELANNRVQGAQAASQTAGRALTEAQAEWKLRYQLLKKWVAFRDQEHGTTVAREVFPRVKHRANPDSAPPIATAPEEGPLALTSTSEVQSETI